MNEEDCFYRSNTPMGSSTFWGDTAEFPFGILSDDVQVNPDFYNWNLVILNYCDGK